MSFFAWIKSFFSRPTTNQPPERLDFYQPKDRLIFHYFNGKEIVKADPVILYKRMMEKGPSLSVNLKVANSPMKDADTAYGKAVGEVREIFALPTPKDDLRAIEEECLTQVEAIELLDFFLAYCNDIKKNLRTSLISPMETSPDSNPSSDASPPTTNSLDSGSTDEEPSTDKPTP